MGDRWGINFEMMPCVHISLYKGHQKKFLLQVTGKAKSPQIAIRSSSASVSLPIPVHCSHFTSGDEEKKGDEKDDDEKESQSRPKLTVDNTQSDVYSFELVRARARARV